MKLIIKQKVFSLLDSYEIFDEYGNIQFNVKSQLSFGRHIDIYNSDGKHIGELEKVLFTWLPKYKAIINGEFVAEIKKEFTFFKPSFTISNKNWTVTGNFFDYNYEIMKNGQRIASISKEIFKIADSYTLDVYDEENILPALLIVLTIDAMKDDASR